MVVLAEDDGAVRVLTLNRPDRLNAWTEEMGHRYSSLLREADEDPMVRVVVVTGAGRGFSVGADFEVLAGLGSGERSLSGGDRPITLPMMIRKPVIAAVNGACAGLGFIHAICCDMIFTAEEAKWTTAFARRGLVAEYGVAWILPKLIGQARALDLLLSGRVFSGAEACQLGLVAQAVPGEKLMAEVMAYAKELATFSSPASMAVIKRQVWGDWNRPLDESRADAHRLMAESFTRPDLAEGVASFIERRAPNFPPLAG